MLLVQNILEVDLFLGNFLHSSKSRLLRVFLLGLAEFVDWLVEHGLNMVDYLFEHDPFHIREHDHLEEWLQSPDDVIAVRSNLEHELLANADVLIADACTAVRIHSDVVLVKILLLLQAL